MASGFYTARVKMATYLALREADTEDLYMLKIVRKLRHSHLSGFLARGPWAPRRKVIPVPMVPLQGSLFGKKWERLI